MPNVRPYPHKHPKPGMWQARISLGRDPETGKYPQKSIILEAPTIEEAKAEAIRLQRQMRNDRTGHPNPTLGDLIEQWFTANPNDNEGWTRKGYQQKKDTHVLPRLGHVLLRDLHAGHIEDFKREMEQTERDDGTTGYAASTINECLSILSQACAYGVRRRLLVANPTREVPRSKMETKQPELPPDEAVATLLAEFAKTNYEVFLVMALGVVTGSRLSELCALRWVDIDFDRQIIHIRHGLDPDRNLKDTKTHSIRAVNVGEGTMKLLNDWRTESMDRFVELTGSNDFDDEWFLFPSETDLSKPRRPDGVSTAILRKRKALGLPRVWIHGTRHIATSKLINAGVDPRTVADRMGWADPSLMYKVYAHSDDNNRTNAGDLAEASAAALMPTPER